MIYSPVARCENAKKFVSKLLLFNNFEASFKCLKYFFTLEVGRDRSTSYCKTRNFHNSSTTNDSISISCDHKKRFWRDVAIFNLIK